MTVFDQAAAGDLDAQRAMIDQALEMGRLGVSSRRGSLEWALFWARLAQANGDERDEQRLVDVLYACMTHACERRAEDEATDHVSELIARHDRLAEDGDDDAAAQLATLLRAAPVHMVERAKALSSYWRDVEDRDAEMANIAIEERL